MPESPRLQLTDFIRDVPDFPKPGILFRDITPLLASPAAFRQAVVDLARPFRRSDIDVVAAAEARGFLFAGPVALELDVPIVPVRKAGKLPYESISYTYELEYGSDTLEIHADAIPKDANVLVLDDVLATGGTVAACCHLIEKAGAKVTGCAFLIELVDLGGAARLADHEVLSLIKYEGT